MISAKRIAVWALSAALLGGFGVVTAQAQSVNFVVNGNTITFDQPPIELNRETMAKYRDQMRKYYYDPTKYKTYLDQLGIKYPTVRADSSVKTIP